MGDLVADLTGKTFLVTGANTGIGKETLRGLAGRGARVVVAGRSEERTRAAISEIAAAPRTRRTGPRCRFRGW